MQNNTQPRPRRRAASGPASSANQRLAVPRKMTIATSVRDFRAVSAGTYDVKIVEIAATAYSHISDVNNDTGGPG